MATFKDALDLTTRTIDRRAFHFRNLVVLVVLVFLACIIWAGIAWCGSPLLGWLSLVPLCGGFLVLDSRLVNHWRDRLLRMWIEEQLDLDSFAEMIASIRMLPAGTLAAMLGTLAPIGQVSAANQLSPVTKKALAATLSTKYLCESDRTIFATLAYAVGLCFVVWTVLAWNWLCLLGCVPAVAVPGLGPVVRWARLHRWRRLIEQLRQQGLDMAALDNLIRKLEGGSTFRN